MRFAWLLQPHKINDKIWGVRKDGTEACRVRHCVFYFSNKKLLFPREKGDKCPLSRSCCGGVGAGGGEAGVCPRAVVLGRIIDLGAFSRAERGQGLSGVTAR